VTVPAPQSILPAYASPIAAIDAAVSAKVSGRLWLNVISISRIPPAYSASATRKHCSGPTPRTMAMTFSFEICSMVFARMEIASCLEFHNVIINIAIWKINFFIVQPVSAVNAFGGILPVISRREKARMFHFHNVKITVGFFTVTTLNPRWYPYGFASQPARKSARPARAAFEISPGSERPGKGILYREKGKTGPPAGRLKKSLFPLYKPLRICYS
jgi:hypothetical protein